MIKVGMVRKMICSFPRSSNAEAFNKKYLAGEIDRTPQCDIDFDDRAAWAFAEDGLPWLGGQTGLEPTVRG